jgi:hypothetical protein
MARSLKASAQHVFHVAIFAPKILIVALISAMRRLVGEPNPAACIGN